MATHRNILMLLLFVCCCSCSAETGRRLEAGYSFAALRKSGGWETFPVGLTFRGPFFDASSDPGIVFLPGNEPKASLSFGLRLQMGWPGEAGEKGYLGIAGLFVEGGLFVTPSVLVSMGTGFSGIFILSKDGTESNSEGPSLGISLSYLPEGNTCGIRIGTSWDWTPGYAGVLSATLSGLFIW